MKTIQLTESIKAKLRSFLGNGADEIFPSISCFECVAINNLPLSKPGSLFHGGVISQSALREMETNLQQDNYKPLFLVHNDRGVLPSGRVFDAKLVESPNRFGQTQYNLHTLFYINNGTEEGAALTSDINTGVIDEVSVGVQFKNMFCSECDFDYMSEDADFIHFFEQTCENGHKIGVDGVHVRLTNLDKFNELSLVAKGAGNSAKILQREQAVMANNDNTYRLAAKSNCNSRTFAYLSNQRDLTIMKLTPSEIKAAREALVKRLGEFSDKDNGKAILAKFDAKVELTQEEVVELSVEAKELKADAAPEKTKVVDKPVDKDEVKENVVSLSQLTETLVDLRCAEKDLKAAQTALAASEKDKSELTAKIAKLEAALTDSESDKAKIVTLSADLDAAKVFLKVQAQTALVAAGVNTPEIPDNVVQLIGSIQTAHAQLSKLPVGGVSLPNTSGLRTNKNAANSSVPNPYGIQ